MGNGVSGRGEGNREEEEAAGTAAGSAPTTGLSQTDARNGWLAGGSAAAGHNERSQCAGATCQQPPLPSARAAASP